MAQQQVRRFKSDEIIFREGDVGDCAYLIEKGRVIVYLGREEMEVPLRVLGVGDFFGEMSLLDASPRSASCRAIGDVQLIVVTKDQLMDRIQVADPVVRLLMRVLLERLRSQNDRLRGVNQEVIAEDLGPISVEEKEAVSRISLENRISHGLDRDEFTPYYQPIYDIRTGKMRGCEALIRWITEEGVIPPGDFMDVMEESSLILRAGKVVIEKSMADLTEMSRANGRDKEFFVSINVSGRQFTDASFVPHLEETRQRLQISAQQIKLELTERIMTEGPEALSILQECRNLGYQLALDDFGTGFSSLQYLAQMPLTDLKIDRSFVSKMLGDEKSLSIIKSLIFLANHLGLKLIAEGIETDSELQMLQKLKVKMGQGYYFSKALPLVQFLALIENSKLSAA